MAEDFAERVMTPAMPICMAYFCCILNLVIPGTGTVVAGFSIFCCARNDDMDFGDKCTSCCCGILFGLLQLVFTAFLLIGWCWSAAWGFSYLEMSRKHYPRDSHRRRIQPITTQPTQRTHITNRQQSCNQDSQHMNISIVECQPRSSDQPPPCYYDYHRGHPIGTCEPPPSYHSLYPDRSS